MKNTVIALLAFVSIAFINADLYSQSAIETDDKDYKFKFSLASDWKEGKREETEKKDAVSYSFEKKDGKMAIMLLAFKVSEVKNLTDFVYTIEKDLTLNIPKKSGEYTDFDMGNYDGQTGTYKDSEFTEVIYYYRTKITDGENFTYFLRFIVPASFYNASAEKEIKRISDSFIPNAE
ncbi:MAG: hypothetical protein JNJ56_09280 [Ignavibacteria bacterium]|nr:hypothetical protein [Ignavibacteria bacterium]